MSRTLRFSLIALFLGASLAGAAGFAPAPSGAVAITQSSSGGFLAQQAAPLHLEGTAAMRGVVPASLIEQTPGSKPSSHKDLFDWINFILLVAVLVYVLRKPVGQFFFNRSFALERDLEEGRKALEAARIELSQAEEKMRRLEADIAAFKASAVQEREVELARLRQVSEEEGKRILESARHMIESATQAARLELKRTAASEAVALAERMIRERLDEAGRARLVARFLDGIRNGKSID